MIVLVVLLIILLEYMKKKILFFEFYFSIDAFKCVFCQFIFTKNCKYKMIWDEWMPELLLGFTV